MAVGLRRVGTYTMVASLDALFTTEEKSHIWSLLDLGFERDVALAALLEAGWDVEAATDRLLCRPPSVPPVVLEEKARAGREAPAPGSASAAWEDSIPPPEELKNSTPHPASRVAPPKAVPVPLPSADNRQVPPRESQGHLLVNASKELHQYRGLHWCSWDALEARLGLEPGRLIVLCRKRSIRIVMVHTRSQALSVWDRSRTGDMPEFR